MRNTYYRDGMRPAISNDGRWWEPGRMALVQQHAHRQVPYRIPQHDRNYFQVYPVGIAPGSTHPEPYMQPMVAIMSGDGHSGNNGHVKPASIRSNGRRNTAGFRQPLTIPKKRRYSTESSASTSQSDVTELNIDPSIPLIESSIRRCNNILKRAKTTTVIYRYADALMRDDVSKTNNRKRHKTSPQKTPSKKSTAKNEKSQHDVPRKKRRIITHEEYLRQKKLKDDAECSKSQSRADNNKSSSASRSRKNRSTDRSEKQKRRTSTKHKPKNSATRDDKLKRNLENVTPKDRRCRRDVAVATEKQKHPVKNNELTVSVPLKHIIKPCFITLKDVNKDHVDQSSPFVEKLVLSHAAAPNNPQNERPEQRVVANNNKTNVSVVNNVDEIGPILPINGNEVRNDSTIAIEMEELLQLLNRDLSGQFNNAKQSFPSNVSNNRETRIERQNFTSKSNDEIPLMSNNLQLANQNRVGGRTPIQHNNITTSARTYLPPTTPQFNNNPRIEQNSDINKSTPSIQYVTVSVPNQNSLTTNDFVVQISVPDASSRTSTTKMPDMPSLNGQSDQYNNDNVVASTLPSSTRNPPPPPKAKSNRKRTPQPNVTLSNNGSARGMDFRTNINQNDPDRRSSVNFNVPTDPTQIVSLIAAQPNGLHHASAGVGRTTPIIHHTVTTNPSCQQQYPAEMQPYGQRLPNALPMPNSHQQNHARTAVPYNNPPNSVNANATTPMSLAQQQNNRDTPVITLTKTHPANQNRPAPRCINNHQNFAADDALSRQNKQQHRPPLPPPPTPLPLAVNVARQAAHDPSQPLAQNRSARVANNNPHFVLNANRPQAVNFDGTRVPAPTPMEINSRPDEDVTQTNGGGGGDSAGVKLEKFVQDFGFSFSVYFNYLHLNKHVIAKYKELGVYEKRMTEEMMDILLVVKNKLDRLAFSLISYFQNRHIIEFNIIDTIKKLYTYIGHLAIAREPPVPVLVYCLTEIVTIIENTTTTRHGFLKVFCEETKLLAEKYKVARTNNGPGNSEKQQQQPEAVQQRQERETLTLQQQQQQLQVREAFQRQQQQQLAAKQQLVAQEAVQQKGALLNLYLNLCVDNRVMTEQQVRQFQEHINTYALLCDKTLAIVNANVRSLEVSPLPTNQQQSPPSSSSSATTAETAVSTNQPPANRPNAVQTVASLPRTLVDDFKICLPSKKSIGGNNNENGSNTNGVVVPRTADKETRGCDTAAKNKAESVRNSAESNEIVDAAPKNVKVERKDTDNDDIIDVDKWFEEKMNDAEIIDLDLYYADIEEIKCERLDDDKKQLSPKVSSTTDENENVKDVNLKRKSSVCEDTDVIVEHPEVLIGDRKCICSKNADKVCACKNAIYCSDACQKKHWKHHYGLCILSDLKNEKKLKLE